MDSFEARLQFISVIKNLQKTLNITSSSANDNTNSKSPNLGNAIANDPIQFYLKNYRQHYEDFHQCLFDTASKMDSLDRLNVLLYYSKIISILKSQNSEFNNKVLNQHILPSLDRMVLLILPAHDWKALTNLDYCIEIFKSVNDQCGNLVQWDNRFTPPNVETPIEELPWFSSESQSLTPQESFANSLRLLADRRAKQHFLYEYYRKNGLCNLPTSTSAPVIIHRMESDREKHKRRKENNWVLERSVNNVLDPKEFEILWKSKSLNGLTKEDYKTMKELNTIAQQGYLM